MPMLAMWSSFTAFTGLSLKLSSITYMSNFCCFDAPLQAGCAGPACMRNESSRGLGQKPIPDTVAHTNKSDTRFQTVLVFIGLQFSRELNTPLGLP